MRCALVALALLALALPASALAGANSNPVAAAVARAVRYWGETPCGGHVSVVMGSSAEAPPAGMNSQGARDEVASMWSTWMTPGEGGYEPGPRSYTECEVHIDSAVWPNWQADDEDFPVFCKQMVHEYGHFEGYPDRGASRGTVQYERPDMARVPPCERYRLLFDGRVYTQRSVIASHRVARRRRRH